MYVQYVRISTTNMSLPRLLDIHANPSTIQLPVLLTVRSTPVSSEYRQTLASVLTSTLSSLRLNLRHPNPDLITSDPDLHIFARMVLEILRLSEKVGAAHKLKPTPNTRANIPHRGSTPPWSEYTYGRVTSATLTVERGDEVF